jgi:hypothetical protein
MIKIAISGKANTGKNTVSNIFRQLLWEETGVAQLAFADPIKKIALTMFPKIALDDLYGSSERRDKIIPGAFKDGSPLTIRQLLQDIGENAKKYNPNIWIINFDRRMRDRSEQVIIATDLRFIDEFLYLKEEGFYLIRLLRQEQKEKMDHLSETQQEKLKDEEFDSIINNDCSLFDLQGKVANICQKIASI